MKSLFSLLRSSNGTLDWIFVRHVIHSVLQLLKEKHRSGFVHSAIHPKNVLSCNGDVELALRDCNRSSYYAPEVLLRLEAKMDDVFTEENDIWAIGNILFESILGYPPLTGGSYDELLSAIFTRFGNPQRKDMRYLQDTRFNCLKLSRPDVIPTSWIIIGKAQLNSDDVEGYSRIVQLQNNCQK
ncbi:MAG: hypothetical protein EZS28_003923 [Streblomastix strix]|uniref:Protein kinase domain-containing protein n=1 Tax=Streblomastix strix TaxID=222440 RepID=A0A5J4WZW2_9EUKA|nr:MAG: hypothetical protein EZS28_003923 [Streblomastix strix]